MDELFESLDFFAPVALVRGSCNSSLRNLAFSGVMVARIKEDGYQNDAGYATNQR